jgi:hypothetical protein
MRSICSMSCRCSRRPISSRSNRATMFSYLGWNLGNSEFWHKTMHQSKTTNPICGKEKSIESIRIYRTFSTLLKLAKCTNFCKITAFKKLLSWKYHWKNNLVPYKFNKTYEGKLILSYESFTTFDWKNGEKSDILQSFIGFSETSSSHYSVMLWLSPVSWNCYWESAPAVTVVPIYF